VALVTLGCARNDVDSEELAGRLDDGGFRLVEDAQIAELVVVNTCGFVEAAKKDSVDALLEASDLKVGGAAKAVVAVGCLAERYGSELASSLPEADAVLGFDDYPDISHRLRSILAGETQHAHTPTDRRALLPISPVDRRPDSVSLPGHGQPVASMLLERAPHGDPAPDLSGEQAASRESAPDLPLEIAPASGPRAVRRRLNPGPMAPLKIASGCDRRCTFCAIPSFRGSFVSRQPHEVVGEARWLADQGVRELLLVSENSTSYGKDLGDLRLLEALLPSLTQVDGVLRVRVSYLQPAETRLSLVDAMVTNPAVADYFDLSFQHASGTVLRRMRRFGDGDAFLKLLQQVRARAPRAGARSNFIVGFPGETDADLQTLCDFLVEARLDAVGIFGYSDEDGTEGVKLAGHLDEDEIQERVRLVSELAEQMTAQRAEERIGERIEVLVETVEAATVEGRADFQGPEVDGSTTVTGASSSVAVGDLVTAEVVDAEGVDLIAVAVGQ
jgi:ribosomal protein S12 methylthiotransferase RimO